MNYPNGIKKNKTIIWSNRGMRLEEDLNNANTFYLNNNIAIIHKKPTPIKIKKIEYPSRKATKITEGYFDISSTTDYNGLYKGKYIDFEAKETSSETSFPLSNIHNHQLIHLKKIVEHGGISFIIIRFSKLNLTFLFESEKLLDFENKKSIKLEYFKNNCKIIKEGYSPRIDYLKTVDEIYFGGKNE